jgi:predicted RNase H-like nuclease
MTGVLGIDAAWTAKEPSGVALLAGSSGKWRCVTVTPSYDSFLALAEGVPVDWTTKAKGAVPEADRLIAAAERLLGGGKIAVVTVDMPLATVPITGRRAADSAVSRVYGGRGAAVHYHPPNEAHSHSKNASWHGDVRYTGGRHRQRQRCWSGIRPTPSCGTRRRSSSRVR